MTRAEKARRIQAILDEIYPDAGIPLEHEDPFTLLVAVVLSCGSIPDDELDCEEAAARLESCCPRFDARRVNCLNKQGCNGNLRPAFTENALACVTERSCDELLTRGICDAIHAQSLQPYQFQIPESFESEVCR